jgi:methionine synthase II (cobalamin-independent)
MSPKAQQVRHVTWIEVAVRNVGIRKAYSAMSWAYNWATARESLKHDPSVEEVAKWWRQSVRTSYREQAAFREAFPTLDSPAQIFEDPAVRSKMATVAKATDAVESAISDVKKDLKILEFAMMPANLRDR